MRTTPTLPLQTDQRRQDLGRRLCRCMAAIHRRGWCDGTGGNFSVVLQHQPELLLLMAPSGVDKGRVRNHALIVVGRDGQLRGGTGRVSAEMPLHRTIVEQTGAGAVLHTHSQAATLLSLRALGPTAPAVDSAATQAMEQPPIGMPKVGDRSASAAPCTHLELEGLEMLKGLEGIRTHLSRIRIPVLPNDQDLQRLSDASLPHLADAPHGLLIAGHGLYAWGEDLEQAMRHLEVLEFLLEQHWRQQLLAAISAGS